MSKLISEEIEVEPSIEVECPHCHNYLVIENMPFLSAGIKATIYCPVCKGMMNLSIKAVKA